MQYFSQNYPRQEPNIFGPSSYVRQQGPVLYGTDALSTAARPPVSYNVNLPPNAHFKYPFPTPFGFGNVSRQGYDGRSFTVPSYGIRPPTHTLRGGFANRGRFVRPPHNRINHSESADADQHYCDVCRVSCVGKQSYASHLAGQKHKKKAQQQLIRDELDQSTAGNAIARRLPARANELSCPLCNITCTGVDTYKTHLAGKQHQRAVKLQTELGKPIPDCEVVVADAEKSLAQVNAATAKKKRSSPSGSLGGTGSEVVVSVAGEECIEEVKNGKLTMFRCRICDCNFSDSNAKSLHLKGKKHNSALRKIQADADAKMAMVNPVVGPRVGPMSSANIQRPAVMLHPPAFFTGPRIPGQTPCRSFRSPGSFFPPPGQLAQLQHTLPPRQPVALPPYMLADERYMQTKLRAILPSERENAVLRSVVSAVELALGRILVAREDQEMLKNPKPENGEPPRGREEEKTAVDVGSAMHITDPNHLPLSGVFRVGALAVDLRLKGQRTFQLVLVQRELPQHEHVIEIAEELEELLKESFKGYIISVAKIDDTLCIYCTPNEGPNKESSSTDATASTITISLVVRLTSTQVLAKHASATAATPPSAASGVAALRGDDDDDDDDGGVSRMKPEPPEGGHDDEFLVRKALLCNYLSQEQCIDALTDVRRALWLQVALLHHPCAAQVVNVARILSSIIRDSRPCAWGNLPDYVLLILLERLSFMDLTPPAFHAGPLRVHAGLLIRRFLEALSAGVLMSPGGELHLLPDPSTAAHTLPFREARFLPARPLLADLGVADREAATAAAQACLRLVSFRQIFKVLDVPKFVPTLRRPLAFNGHTCPVPSKRRATEGLLEEALGENDVDLVEEAELEDAVATTSLS